jgi:hypothetical protein
LKEENEKNGNAVVRNGSSIHLFVIEAKAKISFIAKGTFSCVW